MIIFNESIDLVVCAECDDGCGTDETIMKIKPGQPIDAKIVNSYILNCGDKADIVFANDGGTAYGVRRLSFIVVP